MGRLKYYNGTAWVDTAPSAVEFEAYKDVPLNKTGGIMTGKVSLVDVNNFLQKVGSNVTLQGDSGTVVVSKFSTKLGANCYHDGTNWNRFDISLGAYLFDTNTSVAGGLQIYIVGAGANPIAWPPPVKVWHESNDGPGSGLYADQSSNSDKVGGFTPATLARGRLQETPAVLNNNTTLQAGLYTTAEAGALGLPWTWAHIINMQHSSSDGYNAQIATPLDSTNSSLYFRNSLGGTWQAWKRIWTEGADGDLVKQSTIASLTSASGGGSFTSYVFKTGLYAVEPSFTGMPIDGAYWTVQANISNATTADMFAYGRSHQQLIYYRQLTNGAWGPWTKVFNSDTDGSGSGLDADTIRNINIFLSANTGSHGRSVGTAMNLMWRNFGDHQIIDASQSISPEGIGINNTNPTNAWSPQFPTLMGWSGTQTYGVRVDSARNADRVGGGSITKSTAAPSGGVDGDIWMQYS